MSKTETVPAGELNETIRMVLMGEVEQKGKVYQRWAEVTNLENEGDPLPKNARTGLWDKLIKHGIVGGVYEFKARREDDNLIVSSNARYVGQWKNEDDRRQWQLQDKLVTIERQARREFLPDEIMEPIREAYQKTPPFLKQAFVAWLFQAIQRRKSVQS